MPVPSTPMLDDFKRPDESPLSQGGNWAVLDTVGYTSELTVTSLVCRTASGQGARYRTDLPGLVNCEAWVRLSSGYSGGAHIILRANDVGGSGTWDGYRFSLVAVSQVIQRVTNGSTVTTLATTGTADASPGDVWVGRIVGSELYLFRIRSGVTELLATASDTTYSSGYIAMAASAATGSVSHFGGGEIDSLAPPASIIGGFGATR